MGAQLMGAQLMGAWRGWHLEGGEEDLKRVLLANARVLFRNAPLPQSQQGR